MSYVANLLTTSFPRTQVEPERLSSGSFLSSAIQWFRGEGLSDQEKLNRRVALIACAIFLNLTVIGVVGVIFGAIEWIEQERKSLKDHAEIRVIKAADAFKIEQAKEEVLKKANEELIVQKSTEMETLKKSNEELNAQIKELETAQKMLKEMIFIQKTKLNLVEVSAMANDHKMKLMTKQLAATKKQSFKLPAEMAASQLGFKPFHKIANEEIDDKNPIPPTHQQAMLFLAKKIKEQMEANSPIGKMGTQYLNGPNKGSGISPLPTENVGHFQGKQVTLIKPPIFEPKLPSFEKAFPPKAADENADKQIDAIINATMAVHMIATMQMLVSSAIFPALHALPPPSKQVIENPLVPKKTEEIDVVIKEKSSENAIVAAQNEEELKTAKGNAPIKTNLEAMLESLQSKHQMESKKTI